jgi:TrmH family RNA methyltransferase
MPLTRNRIREIRSLSQKKVRDELGLFVAEGLRLVRDAAESEFEIPEVYSTARFGSSSPGAHLVSLLGRRGARCMEVSPRELARIADTVHAQGVVALVRMKRVSTDDLFHRRRPPGPLVALEGIADPGNLGSIIRTCDWFGAAGILLGRKSVDLYNPKVVRSTMGGIFHVPVVCGVDLPGAVARAKELGYALFVTDPAASLLEEDVRFPERSLIAFGGEARGVSGELQRMADARVAIRRYGRAESLNVGVACGILLAAHRRSEISRRSNAEDT